ncbi:hypothetical protein STRCI_004500 [Streptomyces cinnabarinus]|uniref:Uncharacterized protein n=1 Tax=Streptomyces cinnabarinus TaxID=67287 RepID=A0ABY7KF43_9ACTN|nr:hypothetical protein [Streptomyces cinnabarinus]WAZ23174.1 hypothetical protein STRCI_004500 [Streptomyces cinnabarinus]
MGLRDRIRDAANTHMKDPDGTPNLARRATQMAAVLADTTADHSTAAAAAVAGLGAAAVAAEGALSNYVYPPGDYTTFRDDRKGAR